MKLVVVAKADDVAQQPSLVDGRAAVADLHAAPVGLARHQAVAFEQVAGEGFGDGGLRGIGTQQLGRRLVVAAFHIQAV